MSTPHRIPQPPTSGGSATSPSSSARPQSAASLSQLYGSQALTANETFGSVGNREDIHQTERNVKLFAAVTEDCEVLESCYENLRFAVANKRDQAMQKCDANREHIDLAAKLWKWTKPLNWDFDRLVRLFHFNLSPTEIQLHHDFVEFSFDEPNATLEALRTAAAMSRARVQSARDALRPLDRQFHEAAATSAHGAGGSAPVSKYCVALFELAHTDVLAQARAELQRTDAAIAQAEAQIEADRVLRDSAVARNDVPAIEPPHRNMIKSYVDLLDIMQRRLVSLTATDEDTNVFRKNCAEVVAGARELIDRLGDESRALQQRCLADIRRSEAVRCEQAAVDAEATAKHKEYVLDVKQGLDKNAQQQRAVLDQMHELTKELFRLTEQRKALVEDFTVRKEEEELRSANFEEFGVVRSEHLPYVDRIRDLAERRLAAESGLNEYVNDMQRRFAEMDIESMLDGLVEPELRRYIQTYRGLVFTCGELMTKKTLRIESLLRQRRQLKLQQQVAVSSLDAELGTYVKKHDDLTRALNAAQSDLAVLQNTQNACEKNYAAIGALQQRFGLSCLHPLVEYAAESAEQRQRYADVTTRYVEEESLELDKEKQHVCTLRAINEHERQQSPARSIPAVALAAMGGLGSPASGAAAASSRPATAAAAGEGASRPATAARGAKHFGGGDAAAGGFEL